MKRFSIFVKRLSLSQQLFALIFFFVTFFAAFFFIYLSGKVDLVIEKQMFSNLKNMQASIVEYNGDTSQLHVLEDSSITNLVLSGTNAVYLGEPKEKIEVSSKLFQEMYDRVKSAKSVPQTYTFRGEPRTYYSVVKMNEYVTLISFTSSEYLGEFKGELVSSVINVTVLVVGFFFIILLIWVASLIHPLNQIRNYIEKIKIGMDCDLKVNRQDEIGELAEALVSMRSELKKQERTKEDMVHNISHDLKTPIATIKSYGESIKDGIYPYDTLEKSVDVIIENADRLEKKVHSLLFLNRVEYLISQDSEGARTSMKDVIETVILNIKVIKPDIKIETDLQDDVFFDGLEEPWMVTVENIIENALRYAKSTIEIHLSEAEGLSIANDGPCIEEDRLRVLFKPFEKGKGGKFGLGLSIVAKVVQSNNYEVTGENTSDGVIFRINKKGV